MTDETRALLAHLFRRAGFGAAKHQLDDLASRDYAAAVESLVSPAKAFRDQPSLLDAPLFTSTLGKAQETFTQVLVTSEAPLVERMVLFLSNHFATAYQPELHVDTAALVHQQSTIRRFTLGSFADLAHAMIDDLALACYLNNDRNKIAKPNENLAREMMELFLLGAGNYTERDVKEVARALTGYTLKEPLPGARPNLVFDKALHDDGMKTILGTTAAFTPHGVVDLMLNHPASRRFIATKLVTHFVSPTPDPVLIGAVTSALHPDWQLASALRKIFYSEQFRSPAVRQTLPKTPAEYVVGLMRALKRTEYHYANQFIGQAGQTLFRPPSVAGWPQGKRMLGPGAMLARYNAASAVAGYHVRKPAADLPVGPALQPLLDVFGIMSLSPNTTAALGAYNTATAHQPTATRTMGMITLLASSPDFNLS